MWIVKLALDRPYTFIVMALLILLLSPIVIMRTPVDMFPNINIPVISLAWQYTGLNPEELEGRLTTPFEKSLTTFVDNVEHIESTTYNGQVIVRVFLQPNANLASANAQVSAASEFLLRQLPPGVLPPQIVTYSASSVPIVQLGISGDGMSEQMLNDYAQNTIHSQLITVPGAVVPSAYGGKQRQVSVNLDQAAMESRNIAPADLLNALALQNVVTPSGTIKIGPKEYDVRTNGAPRTLDELSRIPIKQQNGVTTYLRDVATVSDGFQVQTNIVRRDGNRGVLLSQERNCLHRKCGQGNTRHVAAHRHHGAVAAAHDSAGRSIHLRQRRSQRRGARGHSGRGAHRTDDPSVPGQLAQHADRRYLHSVVDPDFDHRAQLPW